MTHERLQQFALRWPMVPVGSILGAVVAGWVGLLVGTALGALLDEGRRWLPFRTRRWRDGDDAREDAVVLSCLFAWAGVVAKADGRVSEAEINAAESVMRELGLDGDRRRLAVELFGRGRRGAFPARGLAWRVRRHVGTGRDRAFRLLAFVGRIAVADGRPSPAQTSAIGELATLLGLTEEDAARVLRRRAPPKGTPQLSVQAAFRTLQVPETATEADVKYAYRRMISRHHPDRLVARGLPDEEIRAAATRTREVRSAFEAIRRARGF